MGFLLPVLLIMQGHLLSALVAMRGGCMLADFNPSGVNCAALRRLLHFHTGVHAPCRSPRLNACLVPCPGP